MIMLLNGHLLHPSGYSVDHWNTHIESKPFTVIQMRHDVYTDHVDWKIVYVGLHGGGMFMCHTEKINFLKQSTSPSPTLKRHHTAI